LNVPWSASKTILVSSPLERHGFSPWTRHDAAFRTAYSCFARPTISASQLCFQLREAAASSRRRRKGNLERETHPRSFDRRRRFLPQPRCVWRETEGADLRRAIIDTTPTRAQKFAAEFGTRVSRYSTLSRPTAIDAVSPCRAHRRTRFAYGSRSPPPELRAGRKPIAALVDEADALIAAAKRSRGVLQIGHVETLQSAVPSPSKNRLAPDGFRNPSLGIFSPRSLDSTSLRLMIHDLESCLRFVARSVVDLKGSRAFQSSAINWTSRTRASNLTPAPSQSHRQPCLHRNASGKMRFFQSTNTSR